MSARRFPFFWTASADGTVVPCWWWAPAHQGLSLFPNLPLREIIVSVKELWHCQVVSFLSFSLFWTPFSFTGSELYLLSVAVASSPLSNLIAGKVAVCQPVVLGGAPARWRQVSSYLQTVPCITGPLPRSTTVDSSLPKVVRPNLETLALGIMGLCTIVGM